MGNMNFPTLDIMINLYFVITIIISLITCIVLKKNTETKLLYVMCFFFLPIVISFIPIIIPLIIYFAFRNKPETLRIIGRVALLFVVMGFFMPVGCNQTGFQLAEYALNISKMASGINTASMVGILYYVLFIVSLLGGILLIPLIMNKKIPIGFDWVSIIISTLCGIYLSVKMKDLFSTFGKLTGKTLQIGGYFIIIGLVVSLLAVIIYSLTKEMENIPPST